MLMGDDQQRKGYDLIMIGLCVNLTRGQLCFMTRVSEFYVNLIEIFYEEETSIEKMLL